MNELFDQSFLRPFGDGGLAAGPAVDVAETADEVIVTAAVPGLKPDDLKLTVTGDVLEMSAQVTEETERKDATYHLRERRSRSFHRSLGLPAPVLADRARAEFENGVLTLTLPKAEDARRKSIRVKSIKSK
jgi:HSP20 family protein